MADSVLDYDDIADLRYDPFALGGAGEFSPKTIGTGGNPVEVRTVPASAPYQIKLFEMPELNGISTTSITRTSGGAPLVEVSRTTTPAAGQYHVNYDELGGGILEFNSAESEVSMDISYYGLGTNNQKIALDTRVPASGATTIGGPKLFTETVKIFATTPITGWGLDIQSYKSIVLGADNDVNNLRTDATAKAARMGAAHYTNAEEPATVFTLTSEVAASTLKIGGGTGLLNAVTDIDFYTATDNTTITGTIRMKIQSDGKVIVGNENAQGSFEVNVGAISTITYGGVAIAASSTVKNASGRTSFLAVVGNNFLAAGDVTASGFHFVYPFNTGANATYRCYQILQDDIANFWVQIDGGAYFGSKIGVGKIPSTTWFADVQGIMALFIGADAGGIRGTNTGKQAFIAAAHYNGTGSVGAILVNSFTSSVSSLLFGGGDSSVFAVNGHSFFCAANSTTSTGTERVRFDNASPYALKTAGTNWGILSDRRIKEKLKPITDSLGKLNALKPTHFEYKEIGDDAYPAGTRTGFIAQEFADVFPGHTFEAKAMLPRDEKHVDEDKMVKGIDADLNPYIVKAIQELIEKNDEIQNRLDALEA